MPVKKHYPLVELVDDQELTAKEIAIIQMMADGLSTKMMSRKDLGLHDTTIETYRYRILKKLKVRNSCECVAYALRNGLIQ